MKDILIKKLLDKFDEYRDDIEDITLKNMDTVILTTKDKWGEATLTINYKEVKENDKISEE